MENYTNQWLDNYRDTNNVEGWVDNGVFNFLKLINATFANETNQTTGGALEIGVHHGKFFIALNALVGGVETKSIAMDLFEDHQHLNIDGSGSGNRSLFEANLRQYDRFEGRNVIIETSDSICADPRELIAKAGGPFRLASVDGGHTAEHTISDIELCNAALHPGGIVLVDDILNSHWLGVIDGVTSYLRGRPVLWPLAVGYNKLVMCRISNHARYSRFFEANFRFEKKTDLCGYSILAV